MFRAEETIDINNFAPYYTIFITKCSFFSYQLSAINMYHQWKMSYLHVYVLEAMNLKPALDQKLAR